MLVKVAIMVAYERGMLIGKGHEGTFRDGVGGEHMGMCILKNHQVVHLRFV